ncbi:MAG: DNA repair protein RecN [Bdellovibrionota bacterium]
MLTRLRIQNFAIIDEVEIEFGSGLNIISGETGAGKSILMDALVLILGGRASADLIRLGTDEATVEALFDLGESANLAEALEQHGIPAGEGELIIRRIVHRSGKNRIFVNGTMANMATLQSLTTALVDLCSQHDQQLIARPEEQLLWIDRFGDLEHQRAEVKNLHQKWREKKTALDSLSTDSTQRAQKIDFLRFQIAELEEAEIASPTEDEELQQELKVLDSAEALFAFVAETEGLVSGGESAPSMLDQVNILLMKVKTLQNLDPKLAEATEYLGALKVHAEELGFFIRKYSQGVSRDEGRLEGLNMRLALLAKLKRKYGPTLQDVISHQEQFQQELAMLENHDSSLSAATDAVQEALADLRRVSEKLSQARAKSAKGFALAVAAELADLHMDRARFHVSVQRLDEPNNTGLDLARFEIAANPGEPMGPLTKVASGGELSRIMLAMHNVVSTRGDIAVYLFDEVDTGIGGKTAVAVGAKLQKVASHNQVICITHLPQVAAFADRHFHVEKSVKKREGMERTVATVELLSENERELELARMLGGNDRDKAALANAKAMLDKVKRKSSPQVKAIPPEKKAKKKESTSLRN